MRPVGHERWHPSPRAADRRCGLTRRCGSGVNVRAGSAAHLPVAYQPGHHPSQEQRNRTGVMQAGQEGEGWPRLSRPSNRSVEAVTTVLAALAAAFLGRLVFGYPPAPIVILIAAVAAAASIALVELLDHELPAQTTTTAPRTPSPPKAPKPWWDQPPPAPEPAPQERGDGVTVIDVRQWSRATIERQYQCPTCGGFDMARGDRGVHRCNDCESSWSWQPPSPWPRVTIDVKARSGVRR